MDFVAPIDFIDLSQYRKPELHPFFLKTDLFFRLSELIPTILHSFCIKKHLSCETHKRCFR